MANILQVSDLHDYSIAIRNSGITENGLQMLEMQMLVWLFGRDGTRHLVEKINAEPDDEYITELLGGDNVIFAGLRALLATTICTNLISQNRLQVARQNVTKQPVGSRQTNKREESEVVQALSYSANNLIFALYDFLRQDGKKPLELEVKRIAKLTQYSTNTSGTIPAGAPHWLSFFGM